jgi:hypothetical protein
VALGDEKDVEIRADPAANVGQQEIERVERPRGCKAPAARRRRFLLGDQNGLRAMTRPRR